MARKLASTAYGGRLEGQGEGVLQDEEANRHHGAHAFLFFCRTTQMRIIGQTDSW